MNGITMSILVKCCETGVFVCEMSIFLSCRKDTTLIFLSNSAYHFRLAIDKIN